MIWWWTLAAAQTCESVEELGSRMVDEVLEANLEGASELGRRAEVALACGEVVAPEVLGKLWVVSGVLAWFDGRTDEARRLLVAGQALAPGAWDPRFGQELTGVWSEIEPSSGEGIILLRPELGEGWQVAVDGGADARTVPAGLHLFQVHDAGAVQFGKVVYVPPGETVALSHTLPSVPPSKRVIEAPLPGAPTPSEGAVAASLSVGVGVDLAGGSRLDSEGFTEPSGKLSVPVELGVRVEGGGLWFRSAAAMGPLVGGSYLYASDGVASRSVLGVGGHVAGGLQVGAIDLGLLAGVQWPSRIPVRAVVGLPLGEAPLRLEARAGLNIATGSRVEGAGTLNLCYLPWL